VKKRIVLLGPPASGKGTQAELIQKRFGLPATSTGAILRREAKLGTELGVTSHKIISQGRLAPDELIMSVVAGWLDRTNGTFLFDGFPRTLVQAERFEGLLAERGIPLELAIFLDASDEKIRERMVKRLTCSNCGKVISLGRHVLHSEDPCPNCGGRLEARADDTDNVLAHRMKEYREKSLAVTDFYGRRGILASVDADSEVAVVFDELSRLIIA
jgi:adenylate kinase